MSEQSTPPKPAATAQLAPPQTIGHENAAKTGATTHPRRVSPLRVNLRGLFAPLTAGAVFLGVGLLLIAGLGLAQRSGWISSSGGMHKAVGTSDHHDHAETYTCPMHPQIRQPEPGRCPICDMELVPATKEKKTSSLDEFAVHVDAAARRVAGIETATARAMTLERTIRSIGEIAFDESRLATITAWVDGRIERLFADYTGVKVRKGDHLVHLYSPTLYAAQVEYLVTRESVARNANSRLRSLSETSNRLLDESREKLQELGMTKEQLHQLEESGQAQTRLRIYAPVGGTVIEKPKVEGEYVKTGDVIYRIADLSSVWLMLELFPDDAAQIHYGQQVEARVQSLPGETFVGRVSFVDPTVDKTTRTVGVRVDIANPNGRLRPGDYASATIHIPITESGEVYDAELAGKWISPRHPQIIRDKPGRCPLCDIELVPTSELGFARQPVDQYRAIIVPRDAVLMAGSGSVVYVETDPGRFEIRSVTLGPMIELPSEDGGRSQSMAVLLDGVKPGEKVATSGNFLIDSQMQLAGKPSVIDPTRAKVKQEEKSGPLKLEYEQPRQLAGKAGAALDRLYATYFAIHKLLAADTKPDSKTLTQFSSELAELGPTNELPEAALRQVGLIRDAVETIEQADLKEFRQRFKSVSHAMIRMSAQVRGPQSSGTFIHFYCPMVDKSGGDWLQSDEPLANPYFGSRMLRCGKAVHRLAVVAPAGPATVSPGTEPEVPVPNPERSERRKD